MRQGGEEPLRALTDTEREQMAAIVRARSERGDLRQRAVALLAVAEGQSREAAARRAGYTKGYTVTRLVRRFNAHGLAALEIAPGRGRTATYQAADRQRILDVLQQPPEREADRSRTKARPGRSRSCSGGCGPTACRRLAAGESGHHSPDTAPGGLHLPAHADVVSDRDGAAQAQGGDGDVVDPEAEQKKGGSSKRTGGRRRRD